MRTAFEKARRPCSTAASVTLGEVRRGVGNRLLYLYDKGMAVVWEVLKTAAAGIMQEIFRKESHSCVALYLLTLSGYVPDSENGHWHRS